MGVHAALLVRSHPSPATVKSSLFFLTLQKSLLSRILIIGLVLSTSCPITVFGDGVVSPNNDTIALLRFKESLLSTTDPKTDAQMRQMLSSWNSNSNFTSACSGNYPSWEGVLCSDGNVWGLRLENMSLSGAIDVNTLVGVTNLRSLSFMNNSLEGPLPDLKKLGSLRSLYLSDNQFSGQIPDDAFADMASLRKVYLANNKFRGTIPTSLAQLPNLLDLSLQGNQFVGRIPKFSQNNDLKVFNVSNNQLEGPIPASLASLSPASFSGNKDLCGKPLDSNCKYPNVGDGDSPQPNAPNASSDVSSSRGTSSMLTAILAIASVGLAFGIIILAVIIICHHRRQQTPRLGSPGSSMYNNNINNPLEFTPSRNMTPKKYEDVDKHRMSSSSTFSTFAPTEHTITNRHITSNTERGGNKGGGKLSFIREDRHTFDLQDLLRASAEVLGSGNFGSSYKAVLIDGKAVVVKRFKQMNNIDRQEFNEHMMKLGKLNHPNLLPLVAYYFRKEEKLLVSDYVSNGSLASHLHGNQSLLDWPTRLKIVKGVAKGMSYLYKEMSNLVVPHGHLKSSNVLLDESFNPILMDYTLVPVMNQEHAQKIMVAYRSPEYIQNGRITKKTDVWSLGILILELLTGKFPPPNYQLPTAKGASVPAGSGAGMGDLVSWVDSIVKEAEALQVFDKELLALTDNSEGEMLKLFQIGMACCEENVSKRLDLQEAVDKIQDLKVSDRTDNNNHNYVLSLV